MDLKDEGAPKEQKHTNEELYHRQMELLKTFLEHHAISQEQYDKSAHDLTEKMGFGTVCRE